MDGEEQRGCAASRMCCLPYCCLLLLLILLGQVACQRPRSTFKLAHVNDPRCLNVHLPRIDPSASISPVSVTLTIPSQAARYCVMIAMFCC
ncbi:hypothetical protein V8C44DRAFT_352629 [Trichoderma aethiopicum]